MAWVASSYSDKTMANCKTTASGKQCMDTTTQLCKPWDMTQQSKANCYMDGLAQEALGIAGAQVNVYKLLGIHEQTKLVDLTGNGVPISGGDLPLFVSGNAFTTMRTEWRSRQSGTDVVKSAFIGYDFGVVRLPNGRARYGIPANVRQHITAINIKQSDDETYRVTKARIERSDNGTEWYGVAVVSLPNNSNLNTIHFKQSVPSRFWRIRPLQFAGGHCSGWGVQALELHEFAITNQQNIQDKILMENRDRDYQTDPILIKGYYDLVSANTDLSKFGIEIPSASYQIKVNFNACVASLQRPIVIGDIIELPSETQYSPDLTAIKRYLEVTDVTWDAGSYTPGWMPTMLLITAQPALASQETRDIFGDLASTVDSSGLFSGDDGNNPLFQDYSDVDQTIRAESNTRMPERGAEGSNTVREFSETELAATAQLFPHLNRVGFNKTGLYVEDAIPQNGAPYTEGPDYPQSPKDGDYHRMTYAGSARDVPARLYRYSGTKTRWVYLETDRREQYNTQKAGLDEYMSSPNKKPAREIR